MFSLIPSVLIPVGYEASAHMAEETNYSQTSAPRGIIFTCLCTGIGGLLILFALLSTYAPVDDYYYYYLAGTGNTVADIFIYVTGSTWGQALTWLVCINFFFSGLSSVSITGRITYALTRDGAFAYSEFLNKVNPTFKSPIRAIMFVFVFDALFLLLPLNPGSALAYFAVIALSTLGFQVPTFFYRNIFFFTSMLL